MKKIALFTVLHLVMISLCTAGLAASRDNLYEMFNDYYQIKVFLKCVVGTSGNPAVKLDVFKDVFNNALKERVNIQFIPVENEEEADVVVVAEIGEYVFTEDPLPIRAAPLFINAVSIIGDTAEPKSAGKAVINYEIRDPKNGKLLFSYKKLTTEVRKPKEQMTGEMGYIHSVRENIDRFIYRAFYKQKK